MMLPKIEVPPRYLVNSRYTWNLLPHSVEFMVAKVASGSRATMDLSPVAFEVEEFSVDRNLKRRAV
jgi:hypothetical protein